MPDLSDTTVAAILAGVFVFVVWGLRRALERPVDGFQEIVGDHSDGEYQALARTDGIDRHVADAFEQKVKVRGREMRRKDEEKRKREFEDRIGGFDVDPF